jgi:ribose 5-phosphate isomerase
MEDGNLVKNSDYKSFMKAIKKDNFEELVKVKDKGSDIDILVRDKGDFITDAILVVSDEDQFILLSMEGRLKLSDFKDININIDGADHFKKAAQ